ncbi:S9 family peptidase [Permianibacter sp. IMCC34836]|uniref:S9 family peptidase n=1 Tax=Permianibacter fluminis TaxID=2738515 RepID=UPI0015534AE3|nr:S9 family peptidase [Permianibacter fluminis]NQD37515.1 S9 family peptidase [Permianibacter fluminis]
MFKLSTLLMASSLLGAAAAMPAQAAPFSVDDLLSFHRVGAPVVSPDGKTIVFSVSTPDVAANKSRTDLWLRSVAGNEPARRLTTHEAGDSSPQWSSDGRSVYFLSSRSGSSQLWRIAINGGEAEQVSSYPLDINAYKLAPDNKNVLLSFEVFADCATLACTAERDGKTKQGSGEMHERLFVRHWDTWDNGHLNSLFIDGLNGNKVANAPLLLSKLDADVPSKPYGGDEEFNFSPDGKTVYFQARVKGVSESWSTNHDIYEVAATGGELKNVTPKNLATDSVPTVSPDGRYLAWLAMARPGFEADKLSVMLRDRKSGDVRDLSAGFDRSLGSLKWSADSKTLYGTGDDNGQHSLFAVNVGSGKWSRVVSKGTVGDFDFAGSDIVYSYDDLKHPAELFKVAAGGGKASQLTTFNTEKLRNISFGDYEQFSFKGANNDTVFGYALKPANYEQGKKYPIAFLVHGGPQGSFGDHFHYRWNAEAFAGQGYAVIMIDFHGSTGYGQAFTDAISLDWGGKPFEDLQKGFDAAVGKYDYMDANRACALGGSYGGYMMNWIAGNWSDRFRCIINHAGIFDTRSMYYTTEELWFTEWENGGPHFSNPEAYEKHNPIHQVNNWKTPMLVIHGLKDFRVPYSQGLSTFTALQRRGVPSELLVFPDENHWILKPQNSKQWHGAVFDWMKRWTQ